MVDRPRYPRTSCCVPFCRRTSTLFKNEWLCGDHWRLVDRNLKHFRTRRLGKIQRLVDRYDAECRAAQVRHTDENGITANADEIWMWANRAANQLGRYWRTEGAIWRRMKRQAIERAAGA